MRLSGRHRIVPYLFIAPWIVGFLAFTLFPATFSLWMSMFDWGIVGDRTFIGFDNYIRMFGDDTFYLAMSNTVRYALILVPLSVGLSLGLAVLLSRDVRGVGLFKTAFYLPTLLTGVALAIVWGWILADRGVLNFFIASLGGEPVRWLTDPGSAMWAMVLTTCFGQGAQMLIFLSALKNVPAELYEAATIDGAGPFRKFGRITLPMIGPAIVFNTIISIIAAFQQITVVLNLTGGGPDKATYFYSLFVYENAFRRGDLGYAASNAWIMLIAVLVLTLVFLRLSRRWSYYEV
ncbi:sugar ABC transporter permease [Agromyces intestinalis]|uniref:Sugar ABC transporter permease n=1 Tax=Agromyces intestinalis TaxID=2592652 RepID=A0A5C1YKH4_9MICO|nr:sugar ABC transporter permease [Agromyces intestinalis]QEO15577.1 sugar ABC transporter permease [Agromyces intestinalis]